MSRAEIIDCVERHLRNETKTEPCEDAEGFISLPVQHKANTEWIPIKWHKVTDEEREREGYSKEITFMLDGSMPSDEQEILICLKNGYVEKDTCYYEEDGYSTDNGYDWIEDIVAWMPLPEPYRAESEGV